MRQNNETEMMVDKKEAVFTGHNKAVVHINVQVL